MAELELRDPNRRAGSGRQGCPMVTSGVHRQAVEELECLAGLAVPVLHHAHAEVGKRAAGGENLASVRPNDRPSPVRDRSDPVARVRLSARRAALLPIGPHLGAGQADGHAYLDGCSVQDRKERPARCVGCAPTMRSTVSSS